MVTSNSDIERSISLYHFPVGMATRLSELDAADWETIRPLEWDSFCIGGFRSLFKGWNGHRLTGFASKNRFGNRICFSFPLVLQLKSWILNQMRQKNRKTESKPITIDRSDSTSIDHGNDFWRANAKCNMLVVDIAQTSRSSLEKMCIYIV